MKKAFYIISSVLLAILSAIFVIWLLDQNKISVPSAVVAAISVFAFGALLVLFVYMLLKDWFNSDAEPQIMDLGRQGRFWSRHPWGKIIIWMVASRILIFVLAYMVDLIANGYDGGIFERMQTLWLRSDSPSYLGIAKNWYVTEGDPRFHIVFFSFYPMVLKVFQLVVGDYFAAAMLTSFTCSIGAAIVLYELAAIDMSRRDALRAVRYMFILPAAFFFTSPMTESLFLLLTVSCMLLIRKKKYLWAGLIGALAAFTRSIGIMMIVPMGIEAIRDVIRVYREGSGKKLKSIAARLGGLLIIPLGLGAYVLINYLVTGNPLQFMEYQWDHWHQRMGLFFNTVSYETSYFLRALNDMELKTAWGLWFPGLVYIFGTLAVMIAAARRMRSSYTGYFIAYFIMAVGPTWLLSAPRYLTAAFPVAIALSALTGGKRRYDIIATVVCIIGFILFMSANVLGWPVY